MEYIWSFVMSSGLLLDIWRLFFTDQILMCLLIKRLGRVFVSKHLAKPLKSSRELLIHSAELLRVSEKTKSSAVCLSYSAAHAVRISYGTL